MGKTSIEWTSETWNPVAGCEKISPGCKHCYAATRAGRIVRMGGKAADRYRLTVIHRDANGKRCAPDAPGAEPRGDWNGSFVEVPEALSIPLRRRKPTMFFVNSMSDLFGEGVSNEYIAAVFGVMAACPQHTFQVLTKRAERLAAWFKRIEGEAKQRDIDVPGVALWYAAEAGHDRTNLFPKWPLPNVWLGVSVEDQQRADERIPHLLRVPAAVRFLSVEPMLAEVDLDMGRCDTHDRDEVAVDPECGEFCNECAASGYSGELSYGHWLDACADEDQPGINWVIVGGESGPGARPFALEWGRSIVAQCRAARVPVFVKQLGAYPVTPWQSAGRPGDLPDGVSLYHELAEDRYRVHLRDRKGGDMNEWPADLRVREWTEVTHA